MAKVFFILFSVFLFTSAQAQDRSNVLIFKDRLQPISNQNIFKTEGYYNWDGSIIKGKDGKYHLFYSRWSKKYKFTGWLTHSKIVHAVAKSPVGPWKFKEVVLEDRRNGKWDAITSHSPKIKFFDGKYYLYYMSTNMGDKKYTENELVQTARTGYGHPNWKILRSNQRTGVAVSNSINGPWKRLDHPLIEPSGPITTLAVNPAITKGRDGKFYLIVKGDKPNEKRFIRNQAMAISDSPIGPFVMQEKPVIDYMDTEDMSLWYDKKSDYYYGLFHTNHEDGFIGMVSSPDGTNWQKATTFKLMPKLVPLKSGGDLKPDRLERPFIYIDIDIENSEPVVLTLSVKKGDESFIIFIPISKNE